MVWHKEYFFGPRGEFICCDCELYKFLFLFLISFYYATVKSDTDSQVKNSGISPVKDDIDVVQSRISTELIKTLGNLDLIALEYIFEKL